MRPQRTREHEFPKGAGGVVFCRVCNAVYFKKSWHHNLRHNKNLREDLPVAFVTCPACLMIRDKKYEGKIVLTSVPPRLKKGIEDLTNAFCRRAWLADPMDRLANVKYTPDRVEITTTENQLAVKLAKKIKEVYKKARVKISYGHARDKASDILIEFLP